MVRIRHLSIKHFRGFDDFSIAVPSRLVLAGEPGAGRSDLVEALARVFDREYRRSKRPDEFDFYDLQTTEAAEVVVSLGGLGDTSASPFLPYVEFWDPESEAIVPAAADPAATTNLEEAVRLGYWLAARPDGTFDERTFWAKSWVSGQEPTQWVTAAQHRLIPFLWQRGIESRPLDLGQRGDLRKIIEQQPGEDFEAAVQRFVGQVEDAAQGFSAQDRVSSALEHVYGPLRGVRRFREDESAADLVRFLPDGGAKSGLLRSLVAAISLTEGPDHLPTYRHGTTALTALRAGLLISAARSLPGALVALDEIGADVDPFLGRHVINELLRTDAQILVASRSPQVVDAFNSDEIVRLYWADGSRRAARGRDLSARTDRFALRFRASQLSPALSARAAVVVDGYHDRLSLSALTERACLLGKMPSYAAAGITFIDADGTGGLRALAQAAREFGIHTIVLADNDLPAGAPIPAEMADIVSASDTVVRLPPRTALERLLLAEIPDDELRRVAQLLIAQFTNVAAPANIATATGPSLRNAVMAMLKQPGQLHVSFVQAVDEQWLCPAAVRVLTAIHQAARAGTPRGLLSLTTFEADDIDAVMNPPDVEA